MSTSLKLSTSGFFGSIVAIFPLDFGFRMVGHVARPRHLLNQAPPWGYAYIYGE